MTYNVPVYLRGTAQVPEQATATVRLQLRDKHTEDRHIHDNNHNMHT